MSNRRKLHNAMVPLADLEEVNRAQLADIFDPGLHQRVVLGYLSAGHVALEFVDSLGGVLLHDGLRRRHISATISVRSGPRVAEARSQMCDTFLDHPVHQECQWLLTLDDDMVFEEDLVDRLLAYADVREVPIVGGFCVAGNPTTRQYSTVYRLGNDDQGWLIVDPVPLDELPETGLVKCGATGAACTLIHRRVLLEMRQAYRLLTDGRPNPYPWYQEGLVTAAGAPLGEDVAFCRKAGLLGIPTHVAMDVEVGHRKWMVMTKETLRAYEGTTRKVVSA